MHSYIYIHIKTILFKLSKKFKWKKKDQAKSVIPTMFAMIYSTVKLSNMTEWMLACIKLCFEILQQHKRAKTFQKSYLNFLQIFHHIRMCLDILNSIICTHFQVWFGTKRVDYLNFVCFEKIKNKHDFQNILVPLWKQQW